MNAEYPDTFRLMNDGMAIMCLHCGLVSHHSGDVENKYCGHCHLFHDDIYPPARVSWIKYCWCGKPFHYTDPNAEAVTWQLINTMGYDIPVSRAGRTWMVPRHYIALHGIKAADLPLLGFKELVR